MRFTFTLDTDSPPDVHPERQANRNYLDKIGLEGLTAAGVGLLMMVAIYTSHEEFKRLVEYSRECLKQGVRNEFLKKMD